MVGWRDAFIFAVSDRIGLGGKGKERVVFDELGFGFVGACICRIWIGWDWIGLRSWGKVGLGDVWCGTVDGLSGCLMRCRCFFGGEEMVE